MACAALSIVQLENSRPGMRMQELAAREPPVPVVDIANILPGWENKETHEALVDVRKFVDGGVEPGGMRRGACRSLCGQ